MVSPLGLRLVNRPVGELGAVYFFFMIVMIKPAKEMSTSKSWNSSSYVTTFTSPPPSGKGQGAKKDHPLKEGG